MVEDLLSFKEMCARFEVTPRTLRHYEYIELLSPTRQGRSRFYGPRDVARMKMIARGRRWGFSLEEMRSWFLIYEEQGLQQQMKVLIENTEDRLNALREQRIAIDDAIEELETKRDQISADMAAYKGKIPD